MTYSPGGVLPVLALDEAPWRWRRCPPRRDAPSSGQPDYALGSVHAVSRDGTLVIASASGSQLASYARGAANVIFVVGAQKLVPNLEAARERIIEHSVPLEDARAYAAYGQNSRVGKILEIHQEDPGRIHVVLIRQAIGF
jgi:acyl-CoA hydrolase